MKALTAACAILTLFAVVPDVSAATPADSNAKAAADAMVKRFADSWNHADGAAARIISQRQNSLTHPAISSMVKRRS